MYIIIASDLDIKVVIKMRITIRVLPELLAMLLFLVQLFSSSTSDANASRSHRPNVWVGAFDGEIHLAPWISAVPVSDTAYDHLHPGAPSGTISTNDREQQQGSPSPAGGGRKSPRAADIRRHVNEGKIDEGGKGLGKGDPHSHGIDGDWSSRGHRKLLGLMDLQKALICRFRDLHSVPSGPNPISNYMPLSNLITSNNP